MSAALAVAWLARDPGRARRLLAQCGFALAEGGPATIVGLRVDVRGAVGEDALTWDDARTPTAPAWAAPGATPRTDGADDERDARPRLLAVGVATVDLERAAADQGGTLGDLPADSILRARVARAGSPGVVLLEPAAEGRLAATLARRGEGPAALYVGVSAAALDGLRARLADDGERPRPGTGPFGAQLLVSTLNPAGPHLLVVPARDPAPRPGAGRSATIAP